MTTFYTYLQVTRCARAGARRRWLPPCGSSDPDPFHELTFPTPLAAKRAIADEIRLPIGKLSEDDRQFIDELVARTLSRPEVIATVRQRFPQGRKGGVGSC